MAKGFQIVGETADEASALSTETQTKGQSIAIGALILGLKALSQRALIAIENLFCLITVGLVFWLWMTIHDPNTYQLIGQGMFAVFVLAANVIVRRK